MVIKETVDHILTDDEIQGILDSGADRPVEFARQALENGRQAQGLTLEELSALVHCEDPGIVRGIYETAHELKKRIYGERIVFFAPLYVSNYCANNCSYCAFRHANTELARVALTEEEIREEIRVLLRHGHKRVLVVAGEDPRMSGIEYLERCIAAVYSVNEGGATIRRANVNCAPLSLEHFKRLHATGIGTFQCFQETFHRPTYRQVHPSGPKSHYDWRILSFDRAMEAGIDDVGTGVLFGLYDWRFEIIGLLGHARYLETKFGVGPHTMSVPRLEPAQNSDLSIHSPYMVSDDDFRKIIALLRIAVPYTGMILSTRESAEMRDELFALGISQASAGSRTDVGAYAHDEAPAPDPGDLTTAAGQFELQDHRQLHEMVQSFLKGEAIPSFCTACYRSGRTGDRFMELAKSGKIHNICQPNALASLKEYLMDYADEETRALGDQAIKRGLAELPENLRKLTEKMIARVEAGERDVYI